MNGLEVLDILTVVSFVLQVQNQGRIIDLADVQDEVNRAVEDIHQHLQEQDSKIDHIIEVMEREIDRKIVGENQRGDS